MITEDYVGVVDFVVMGHPSPDKSPCGFHSRVCSKPSHLLGSSPYIIIRLATSLSSEDVQSYQVGAWTRGVWGRVWRCKGYSPSLQG